MHRISSPRLAPPAFGLLDAEQHGAAAVRAAAPRRKRPRSPPLFSCHVCEHSPSWFAMSMPGISAMLSPWSHRRERAGTGARRTPTKIRAPKTRRRRRRPRRPPKSAGCSLNVVSFSAACVPRTYESYPAAFASSCVPASSASSSEDQKRGASNASTRGRHLMRVEGPYERTSGWS